MIFTGKRPYRSMKNLCCTGNVAMARLSLLSAVLCCCAPTLQATVQEPRAAVPDFRLIPQAEETPLPSRDASVAAHWPKEIKTLLDNLLSLFPRDGEAPTVREIERRFGISLTERELRMEELYSYSKYYVIGGTRYTRKQERSPQESGYAIFKPSYGSQAHVLTLAISPKESGFCLDPYELAVYTGAKFSNGDVSVHVKVRHWPPAYVWGMFSWSKDTRYIADQRFAISIASSQSSASCVDQVTVYGSNKVPQ